MQADGVTVCRDCYCTERRQHAQHHAPVNSGLALAFQQIIYGAIASAGNIIMSVKVFHGLIAQSWDERRGCGCRCTWLGVAHPVYDIDGRARTPAADVFRGGVNDVLPRPGSGPGDMRRNKRIEGREQGLSTLGGSSERTSVPSPPNWPLLRAAAAAASSTSGPRDVLSSMAPLRMAGFSRDSAVSLVRGKCSEMTFAAQMRCSSVAKAKGCRWADRQEHGSKQERSCRKRAPVRPCGGRWSQNR